jgi:hypothetical protein
MEVLARNRREKEDRIGERTLSVEGAPAQESNPRPYNAGALHFKRTRLACRVVSVTGNDSTTESPLQSINLSE